MGDLQPSENCRPEDSQGLRDFPVVTKPIALRTIGIVIGSGIGVGIAHSECIGIVVGYWYWYCILDRVSRQFRGVEEGRGRGSGRVLPVVLTHCSC